MGSQVPQHVDVVLVEPHVEPSRVEVVEVAEGRGRHDVAQGPHGMSARDRIEEGREDEAAEEAEQRQRGRVVQLGLRYSF